MQFIELSLEIIHAKILTTEEYIAFLKFKWFFTVLKFKFIVLFNLLRWN